MSEGMIMFDDLKPRAALAGATAGRIGAGGKADLTLTALPEGYFLHLLAKPFDEQGEAAAAALAQGIAAPLRKTAPGQWYVAGDLAMPAADISALEGRFAPALAISDQSHGRVRIGISGVPVERMLAKLIGADVSQAAFPAGHATTLYAGHIAVHAYRIAEDAFELSVLRGFALDLWDSLIQAGAEFGIEATAA